MPLSSINFTLSPQAVREREKLRKERTARLNKELRRRLSNLWKARYGGCSFLPDNEEGRTMLMVMLRVGTTTESAMEMAPWLTTEAEVKAKRKAASKIPWNEIGKLIKLTYAERMAHELYCWMPIDVTPEEVRERQKERTRQKNREWKRKDRAKKRRMHDMLSNTNDRKDAILRMLAGADAPRPGIHKPGERLDGDWTVVSALVKRAETVRAFRRPDGRALRNLRDAVHCTLELLKQDGMVETETRPGMRGQVCFVRLIDVWKEALLEQMEAVKPADGAPHQDVFCDRRSVGGVVEAESADNSVGSAENGSVGTVSRLVSTEMDPDERCPEAHQKAPKPTTDDGAHGAKSSPGADREGPLACARGRTTSLVEAKRVAAKKLVADEHLYPPHTVPPRERLH
jgi:hypothetical protein